MRTFSARSTLLVLTGTWIIAAGVYSYAEMRGDIEQVIRFRQLAAKHPPVIPARCSEGHATASPALMRQDSNATHCWMELSRFERLYPEVAAVTDEDASARVIMAAGEVLENRIEALEGDSRLQRIRIRNSKTGTQEVLDLEHLFLMTGAEPNTSWLNGCVTLDKKQFIKTGADLGGDWKLPRPPYLLETSLPGVFAVGDIRAGSVKRVASAVGEGSMAVQFVHKFLATG